MLCYSINETKPISMVELEKVLLESAKRLDIEMFEEFYIHTEDYKQSKRLFLLKDMTIGFNKFKEFVIDVIKGVMGICLSAIKVKII
jgi:hypothetical protein